MSYFCIEIAPAFYYVKAPGERFELSFPCENALYGKLFAIKDMQMYLLKEENKIKANLKTLEESKEIEREENNE